ncbi:kinase-like protein [Xylaria sp. FL0064]|nr:kinase-like protein [Xylaria sp. FL0064]
MMDPPGTVFYLAPFNYDRYALGIICDASNQGRRTSLPGFESVLRIGLDQKHNTKILARFGRREHNDVILNYRFPRVDQCYFDFNEETGELLLHDVSEKKNTDLCDIDIVIGQDGEEEMRQGRSHMWKAHRQCVVVLSPDPYPDPDQPRDRRWIFRMHDARFLLIPRSTEGQDRATCTRERLAFAAQHDPEQTLEGTLQRIITRGLQSLRSEAQTTTYYRSLTINTHDTRFRTPLEPRNDDVTRYIKLRRLGRGGQGEVHEVVDTYDGAHFACKIMEVKSSIPERKIYSARDFRVKTEQEVMWIKQMCNSNIERHIVPYLRYQGFETAPNIEIFMPVYDGSLHDLIPQERSKGEDALYAMIFRMISHVLTALDCIHTQNPPLIHRDVKPANILYKGDRFFLTDFGIAKTVDASATKTGTKCYAAPEVHKGGEQTPKVDIYGLGATVVECLEEFPEETKRQQDYPDWEPWHRYLQGLLRFYRPQFEHMLGDTAGERPTARQLLEGLPPLHTSPTSGLPATNELHGTRITDLEAPTPMDWSCTSQAEGMTIPNSAPTPMEWSRATGSAGPGPPQRDKGIPLQPNPAVQPRERPNRAEQPDIRRARSVQSTRSAKSARSARTTKSAVAAERGQKGHRRGGSSKNGSRAPPLRSGGVTKRSSNRKPRLGPRSIQGA